MAETSVVLVPVDNVVVVLSVDSLELVKDSIVGLELVEDLVAGRLDD